MVANILGVELEFLSVKLTGNVDARDAIAIDNQVHIGFQSMKCTVRLRAKEGINPKLTKKLREAAEHCCVFQRCIILLLSGKRLTCRDLKENNRMSPNQGLHQTAESTACSQIVF
jgi:hypothetical protein